MHRRLHHRGSIGAAVGAGHAAAQAQRQPLHDAVHGERHHHRRNAEQGDARAVAGAHQRAHAERQGEGGDCPRVAAERTGDHQDRAGVEHPWHREIDAADEDDEGLPRRHQPHEGGDGEDRANAVEAREAWPDRLADHEQQDAGEEGIDHAPPVGGEERADHRLRLTARPIILAEITAASRNRPS
jgi:hypothetical protein